MLAFAGGPIRGDDPVVVRGAELVAEYLIATANDALRAAFGAAELPEDVSPSSARALSARSSARKAKRSSRDGEERRSARGGT